MFEEENVLKPQATAVVIGASGGIGRALFHQLQEDTQYSKVVGCSRHAFFLIDLLNEDSIAHAAQQVSYDSPEVRLIIDATGVLEDDQCRVEKSWKQLNSQSMAHYFAVNAIGPALLMKHFLPLFPKNNRCVFVTLSARVGSIGDNHLGGWYSYRASKAALNQLVRTAAIELRRVRPEAICVALHPGTVQTALSERFAKAGLEIQTPDVAAQRILNCVHHFKIADSGGFFDQLGRKIDW